jgi:hypothetical protein
MPTHHPWDRRVVLGKNPWDRRVVLGKNPWDRRVVLGKNPWDRRVALGKPPGIAELYSAKTTPKNHPPVPRNGLGVPWALMRRLFFARVAAT